MTTLNAFLSRERRLLVDRWLTLVLGTYPPDVARAFAEESDAFRNPVGHTLRGSLDGLVDELLGDFDERRVAQALDPIVRIRAVQCFAPAEAVGFVFGLKRVIREVASVARESPTYAPELGALDDRIDHAALVACNLFSACRGRIAGIQAREYRRRQVGAGPETVLPVRPQESPEVRNGLVPAGKSTT
jgi:hypothetical protein